MKIKSFIEFYPFYLSQHSDIWCRRMHFVGIVLAIISIVIFIFTFNILFLALMPIFGYGCAWIGHFVFEKNTPTMFLQPWYRFAYYSFLSDWKMFKDMITNTKPNT